MRRTFPERAAELRETRGTRWLAVCALAVLAAATLVLSPEPQPQLAPLAVIAALLAWWRARRQFSLARIAEIGAGSEKRILALLAPLLDEVYRLGDEVRRWQITANVYWKGNGDIDVVVVAPFGPTFVIEIKTRHYGLKDLRRTRRAAGEFQPQAIPILVTGVRGHRRIEAGVNVCGRDELLSLLRDCHADYHRRLAEALRHRAVALSQRHETAFAA